MATIFDAVTFAALVRTRRGERSLRELATEIGTISPSALMRLERGETPEIKTFLLLCDWLHLAPGMFLRPERTHAPDLVALIEQELHADGVLAPEVIEALLVLLRVVRSPQVYQNY